MRYPPTVSMDAQIMSGHDNIPLSLPGRAHCCPV